jgi:outer membrane receptor protein involved in Fe transport
MRLRHTAVIGLSLLLCISLGSARETSEKQRQEQTKKEKKADKKKEKTKLFQLTPVEIEVVEYLRDIEIPNMTVVKPELFPMSIGTSLDTALERQAGVDIQRIQEVGTAVDDDSIKIRGLGSRRIKVTKNGRLMNTSGVAGGYFIDWTMIPLTNVDRVEVIKGVGDPRYGNILGGIINLVPRRLPSEAPATEIQVAAASYQTSSLNLFHAYKPGAIEYSLGISLAASDGYLKNGNMSFGNIDLHLGYDLSSSGRLTSDITYSQLKKGFIVPNRAEIDPDMAHYVTPVDPDFPASDGEYMYGGMGAYPEPGSWWEKRKWLFDLGYEQGLGDFGIISLRFWRNHGNRDAYNTRTSMGRIFHKKFFDDRSQGFSADYSHRFTGQTVTLGLDYAHLSDDGDTNYAVDFRAPFRNGYYVAAKNIDFYLMDEILLMDEQFSLVPGLRYMSYKGLSGPSGEFEQIPDIEMSGWAPSFKISYNYDNDNILYFTAARALRMPTPPEHYWHYDFDDAGVDTSRLPFSQEDGFMIQGGWKVVLPTDTRIEISPYYYGIRNYIQFDLINFVAYNIKKATIYGLELEAAHRFGGGWSAFFNYTYQKSRTEGDPFIDLFVNSMDGDFDQIPGLPEHKANLGLQFRADSGASIAVFGQVVSSQEVIYNNNRLWNPVLRVRTQNAYARIDLEGRYPISAKVEVGLFARNILDARYQERYGFAAAGRNVGLSLKAKF